MVVLQSDPASQENKRNEEEEAKGCKEYGKHHKSVFMKSSYVKKEKNELARWGKAQWIVKCVKYFEKIFTFF